MSVLCYFLAHLFSLNGKMSCPQVLPKHPVINLNASRTSYESIMKFAYSIENSPRRRPSRIRVSIIGQPMSCTWLTKSTSIVENDIIDNLWRTPSARNRWAKAYQLCRILFPSYCLPSRALAVGLAERDGFLVARVGTRKRRGRRERRGKGEKDVRPRAGKGRGELSRAAVCRSRVGKASSCRGTTSQA